MSKNVICFSTDANYIKYAELLTKTIYKNNINSDVYCRCVDFTSDEKKHINKKIDCTLFFDDPGLSNKKSILKEQEHNISYTKIYKAGIYNTESILNLKKMLYSPRSVYTCHSRFKSILELFKKGYERVLSLDCDTIVMRNFDHIFNIEGFDLHTIKPSENYNREDFFKNEGMLLFVNTKDTITFLNNVCNGIFTDLNYLNWNIDSKILTEEYNRKKISINFLDYSYKDRNMQDNSYMWSGDSINKYKSKFADQLKF
tara:strand:+ start:12188 stop:12958 length:771 start_codon:yes stop_codon:yes gene_type:complete